MDLFEDRNKGGHCDRCGKKGQFLVVYMGRQLGPDCYKTISRRMGLRGNKNSHCVRCGAPISTSNDCHDLCCFCCPLYRRGRCTIE